MLNKKIIWEPINYFRIKSNVFGICKKVGSNYRFLALLRCNGQRMLNTVKNQLIFMLKFFILR